MYVSPFGFSSVEFRFQNKKPDPARKARGEGNCLIFKLSDGDYSSGFYDAIQNGDFLKAYGDFDFSFDISKIPEKKIAWEKELAEFLEKQNK